MVLEDAEEAVEPHVDRRRLHHPRVPRIEGDPALVDLGQDVAVREQHAPHPSRAGDRANRYDPRSADARRSAPCGCSSVGRARPSQGRCREFESRHPLHIRTRSRRARHWTRRRCREFESRHPLHIRTRSRRARHWTRRRCREFESRHPLHIRTRSRRARHWTRRRCREFESRHPLHIRTRSRRARHWTRRRCREFESRHPLHIPDQVAPSATLDPTSMSRVRISSSAPSSGPGRAERDTGPDVDVASSNLVIRSISGPGRAERDTGPDVDVASSNLVIRSISGPGRAERDTGPDVDVASSNLVIRSSSSRLPLQLGPWIWPIRIIDFSVIFTLTPSPGRDSAVVVVPGLGPPRPGRTGR